MSHPMQTNSTLRTNTCTKRNNNKQKHILDQIKGNYQIWHNSKTIIVWPIDRKHTKQSNY